MSARVAGACKETFFMVCLWLSAFAPVVASWQEEQMFVQGDIFARSLLARSPAGKLTDTSITVFADDLAKIRLLQKSWLPVSATAEEAILCHKTSSQALDSSLEVAGIAQNMTKAVVIPAFFGIGAIPAFRQFLLDSKAHKLQGRHLGAIHVYSGSNGAEIQSRIDSVWRALPTWASFGEAANISG